MKKKTKKAKPVSFVGAGPGDPGLITVKGMRLLGKADVVVYTGSLVMEGLVREYCKEGASVHDSASMTLEEIMEVIAGAAKKGKKVVRLHTGDTSIYSALGEQAAVLEKEGIEYEVVPGVSSFSAASAALRKELTLPGVTQTVILTRIEGRTPMPPAERLSLLSGHGATVCIFLSASMMDKVVAELKEGYPPQTPVAVVYRASWKDEKVVRGTLSDIEARVKEAQIDRHAIIIVGRVLGEEARSRLYSRDFSHGCRG